MVEERRLILRRVVGYYYDLRNARISSVETIASVEALVEKLTIVFASLETIYFDASGNSSRTTSASWAASRREGIESAKLSPSPLPSPSPTPTPAAKGINPFDLFGLFSSKSKPEPKIEEAAEAAKRLL
jgi:hypothetical protein